MICPELKIDWKEKVILDSPMARVASWRAGILRAYLWTVSIKAICGRAVRFPG